MNARNRRADHLDGCIIRLRWREKQLPIGELGHAEYLGYSMPRNLNDRTYTVVWLALSLDPIDRQHAST